MHGYELRKRLNLMLGWGRVLSYGSLYPALKKMLRANLITEVTATVTPTSRRPRIVYEVTEASMVPDPSLTIRERAVAAWPQAWGGQRLQERLQRVQDELERTQAEVNRYAAELQRHGVESVEREVMWLSELIRAERGNTSPASPPTVRAGGTTALPSTND